MKILHMIDDYRILCEEETRIGRFEAYRAYTEKYPYFFGGVFRYLYCRPIEDLRSMIEGVEPRRLLETAEDNYRSGAVDHTVSCVKNFTERMNVDFEFTLLLGLELSNIGGCATPSDTGDPHLYIGIDRLLEREWIELFVVHESFHMLRAHTVRDSAPETVFSRAVEEGLASYASLWAYNMGWSVSSVAKVLGVSEKQAEELIDRTDELLERIKADGEKSLSAEMMNEYFVVREEGAALPVIGYYVGLYLTHLSVKMGVDFKRFISAPRDEIVNAWFS